MAFPRQRFEEWMDADSADAGDLQRSLDFIEKVNRRLGYTRATISHLDRLAADWPLGRTMTILDVATGSGDVPRAVCSWADRRGIPVRIVAVDRHPVTLGVARRSTCDPRIEFIQGDALALPLGERSLHFVLCSMFLHHLDPPAVIRVLREIDRVADRGVIVADLLRHRRALAWIVLGTLFSNPMVRHDARASVRQAFTRAEIERLRDSAGMGYAAYHRHFGHRFVLAGLK